MPKSTPETPDTPQRTTKASDAAVAEADAADADAAAGADETPKREQLIHGTFGGVDFEFKRKRLDSIQFRRLMQRGRDILALEWLLGETFDEIMVAMADEDGVTDEIEFRGLFDAIGEAAGTGN